MGQKINEMTDTEDISIENVLKKYTYFKVISQGIKNEISARDKVSTKILHFIKARFCDGNVCMFEVLLCACEQYFAEERPLHSPNGHFKYFDILWSNVL